MKALSLFISVVLLFACPLWADNAPGLLDLTGPARSVAAPAGVFGVFDNPAGLNDNGAGGMGLFLPHDPATSVTDGNLIASRLLFALNLPGLSFTAGGNGRGQAVYGLHSAVGDGAFSLGMSWDWAGNAFTQGDGVLGMILRPSAFLSLAAVKRGIYNWNSGWTLGAGLRPLALLGQPRRVPFGDRILISADADLSSSGLDRLMVGASVELLDGVILGAGWNPSTGAVELNGLLRLGGSFAQTRVHTSTSFASVSQAWYGLGFDNASRTALQSGNVILFYNRAKAVSETAPRGFFGRGAGTPLYELLGDLRAIAKDTRIKAVVFKNQDFSARFSQALEIRDALLEIKKSGKKIYFFIEAANRVSYALAAACADRIVLANSGMIDIQGFHYSPVYLGDMFKAWGIEIVNFASHPAKSGANPLSASDMSPEERRDMGAMLAALDREFVAMIASGRGSRLKSEAAALIAQGPYLHPQRALEAGLVDAVALPDEFSAWLSKEHPFAQRTEYQPAPESSPHWQGFADTPRVVLVTLEGEIVNAPSGPGRIGGKDTALLLKMLRQNPAVAGILLRIDSPGGDPYASTLIARELELCRTENKKPIVVSMGAMAASGGYYIASAGSTVFATPTTVTGSIGVLAFTVNAGGLLDILKARYRSIGTTDFADFASPWRPLAPAERQRIQADIMSIYQEFVQHVARHRKLDQAAVELAAQGKILTAAQALEYRLIDRIGGLHEAAELLRSQLNPEGDIALVAAPPAMMMDAEDLETSTMRSMLKAGLGNEASGILDEIRHLTSLASGRALWMAPFTLEGN